MMTNAFSIVVHLARRCRAIWTAGLEGEGQPSSGAQRRSELDPLFGDLHF